MDRSQLEDLAEAFLYEDLLSSIIALIIFYERQRLNAIDAQIAARKEQALNAELVSINDRIKILEEQCHAIECLLRQIVVNCDT